MAATEQAKLLAEQSMVTLFGVTFNIYAAIIIALLIIIAYAMFRADKDPKNQFQWAHLVTDVDQATGTIKASATKILQLVGGITGTFIVIKLTLQNNISFDIFGVYLAYVASIDGFSKFMTARYGVRRDEQPYYGGNGYNSPYSPPVDGSGQGFYRPPTLGADPNEYPQGPMPRPPQD